jgi:hypothetical protein
VIGFVKDVGKEGTREVPGVLIAEVEDTARTSGSTVSALSSRAPTSASLVLADRLNEMTEMLANVNSALDDRIYFLVDEVREERFT